MLFNPILDIPPCLYSSIGTKPRARCDVRMDRYSQLYQWNVGLVGTLFFVFSICHIESQPTRGKTSRSNAVLGRSHGRWSTPSSRRSSVRPGREQTKDLETCISKCEKKNRGVCKTPQEVSTKAERVAEEFIYPLDYKSLRDVPYYKEDWLPYTCYCSQPGMKGLECNEKCPPGQYGPMCWAPCSEHCKFQQRCNARNGACSGGCKEGYHEPNCIHKKKCVTKSPTCVYGYCYSDRKDKVGEVTTSQECICSYGFKGIYCDQECVKSYGFMCRIPCGKCTTEECDRYTGACEKPLLPWRSICKNDYEPPNCFKKKSKAVDTNVVVVHAVVEYFTKLEQGVHTLEPMETLWKTLNLRGQTSINDAVKILGPDLEIYMNLFHKPSESAEVGSTKSDKLEITTVFDDVPLFRAGADLPEGEVSAEAQQVAMLQVMVLEWEEEMKSHVRASVNRAFNKPTAVSIARVTTRSMDRHVRRRQIANAMEVEYEIKLPSAMAANQNLEETVARAVQYSAVNFKSRTIPGLQMDKDSVRVTKVDTPQAASQSAAPEAIVVFGITVFVCVVLLATTLMCFISYKSKQRTSKSTSKSFRDEGQRDIPQISRSPEKSLRGVKAHRQTSST